MSDDEYYEDDDDQKPSDATILFAQEVQREFKKAFPLKAETQKKHEEMMRRRRTPAVCKKLNFDETLSESFDQVELMSARKNADSAQRKLELIERENAKLKEMIVEKDEKLEKLSDERNEMRNNIFEHESQARNTRREMDEKLRTIEMTSDQWKVFARKYYIWTYMAQRQLEAVQEFVEAGTGWDNVEEVQKLNDAPMDCMRDLHDFQLTQEIVDNLAIGSIQEYSGVTFEARPHPEMPIDCARDDTSNATKIEPMNYSEYTVLNDSNMSFDSTVQRDHTMMTDGGMNNYSTIEHEKNEKIQRLLLENSVLKDKLVVSNGRAEQSMIFEERNRTLEIEKGQLQSRLDKTFSEIEGMRIGQARKLFNFDEKSNENLQSSSKTLKFVDRVNQLVSENSKLEKDFEAATSRLAKVSKELKECERRNSHLEDVYSDQIDKYMKSEKDKNEALEKLKILEAEIESLKKELEEKANFVPPTAAESTVVQQPTDAGNSTQIFHMPFNPLVAAHEEYQAAESRKRKLEENDGLEGNEAKRQREEVVAELEERLRMCEREKNVIEESYNLHKELANKFRQVCVALTGLQIKLKDADEGICTVQSEYEEGAQRLFVFKCFYGTTRIDMLDVNCASSTEMIRKWEPLMKKYIGERNSIPAFLAAMTLQLEKERDFDQTMLERTHTFSVLHED